jgi:hypothetical protein
VEEGDLAADKSAAAALGGWIVFEDECGQSMRPPRSRTWGRRGITPVIRVRGGGTGRVSVAGLACYRPGHRSRLIYRLHCYRGRKGETKAFTWTEYRDLLIAAHRQLPGGNVVLVWDNLNVHLGAELRDFTGAQAWLQVFRLPAYAPDLNPVEGIWSVLKGGVLANLAVASFAHLLLVIRHGLKKIQYRPGLIEGCLAGTGLTLDQAEQPNGHHELKTFIRVIEDQITTLRPYNARYTGDHRSSFRKRYAEMITRISLDMHEISGPRSSFVVTPCNSSRGAMRTWPRLVGCGWSLSRLLGPGLSCDA